MPLIHKRKNQHVKIVLEKAVEPLESSFDDYEIDYKCFPEINFDDIDTSIDVFGYKLTIPFFISSMTGGHKFSKTINKNIAIASQKFGVGFGLGSMRIIKEYPEVAETFMVKQFAPDVPVFGNFGVVQLNYGFTLKDIKTIIDKLSLDGIFLHINPLQEAIQPEGDRDYRGILKKMENLLKKIDVPVIVKEVGHGISLEMIEKLTSIGVKWVDVSGKGGTSCALVEGYRREDGDILSKQNIGMIFADFGHRTADILFENKSNDKISLIAGGGVRNGLHIAKSIAMGAKLATSASPFLSRAIESSDGVYELLSLYKEALKVAMFVTGSKNLQDLSKVPVSKISH